MVVAAGLTSVAPNALAMPNSVFNQPRNEQHIRYMIEIRVKTRMPRLVATHLTHAETRPKPYGSRAVPRGMHMFYTPDDIAVSAQTVGSVHINVSIEANPADVDKRHTIVETPAASGTARVGTKIRNKAPAPCGKP